ncbi:hypothetical protein ON010_g8449 [Phytophthora cinnamomi]|nr:hypothetical protein ON010_g8449 [Phytophthora cinnamomi]
MLSTSARGGGTSPDGAETSHGREHTPLYSPLAPRQRGREPPAEAAAQQRRVAATGNLRPAATSTQKSLNYSHWQKATGNRNKRERGRGSTRRQDDVAASPHVRLGGQDAVQREPTVGRRTRRAARGRPGGRSAHPHDPAHGAGHGQVGGVQRGLAAQRGFAPVAQPVGDVQSTAPTSTDVHVQQEKVLLPRSQRRRQAAWQDAARAAPLAQRALPTQHLLRATAAAHGAAAGAGAGHRAGLLLLLQAGLAGA